MTTPELATLEQAICAWNLGDLERFLDCCAEDVSLPFLPPPLPQGRAGARVYFDRFLDAFPDLRLELVHCAQEAGILAVRIRLHGTQTGSYTGIPPTYRAMCCDGLLHLRFEDSAVVECCFLFDSGKMLRQLGILVV